MHTMLAVLVRTTRTCPPSAHALQVQHLEALLHEARCALAAASTAQRPVPPQPPAASAALAVHLCAPPPALGATPSDPQAASGHLHTPAAPAAAAAVDGPDFPHTSAPATTHPAPPLPECPPQQPLRGLQSTEQRGATAAGAPMPLPAAPQEALPAQTQQEHPAVSGDGVAQGPPAAAAVTSGRREAGVLGASMSTMWVHAPRQCGDAARAGASSHPSPSSTCSPPPAANSSSDADASVDSTRSSCDGAPLAHAHRHGAAKAAAPRGLHLHAPPRPGPAGIADGHTCVGGHGAHVPFRHASARLAAVHADAEAEVAMLVQPQQPQQRAHQPQQREYQLADGRKEASLPARHHRQQVPELEAAAPPAPQATQLPVQNSAPSAAEQLRRSTGPSDIVRTQYIPLDEDSDSSDLEMEVHLMRKYGIKP